MAWPIELLHQERVINRFLFFFVRILVFYLRVALGQAVNLAQCLAKFPQATLRYDRRNAYAFGLGIGDDGGHVVADDGVMNDMKLGLKVFANGKWICS